MTKYSKTRKRERLPINVQPQIWNAFLSFDHNHPDTKRNEVFEKLISDYLKQKKLLLMKYTVWKALNISTERYTIQRNLFWITSSKS